MKNNPCTVCSISKECCRKLRRLMLTEEEFKAHFESQTESISLEKSGRFYMVSSKEGRTCPHLDKEGCRIYDRRPIDCRLFPYIMRHVFEQRGGIKVVFHQRANCPQKRVLYTLMPEAEAKALILSFAKKVYGEPKPIKIQREKSQVARLRNRAEAAIRRVP